MRPLELNLATRPYRNNTLVWAAYIGLCAAAAAFSYWNVSSFRHYGRELAELDRVQGNLDQERRDLTDRHRKILRDVKKYDRVAIGRRTSKANEVIDWKAFSWTRLFNRLEAVLPYNIKMTSVRPVFRNRDRERDEPDERRSMPVKVEGLARNWDSLFELETALIDSVSFGRVLPRHIDKMDNGELAFSIEFAYFPDELDPAEAPAIEVAADAAGEDAPSAPAERDEPAVESAEAQPDAARRRLPQAAAQPQEVTDEWAAQAERAGQTDETAQPPATAVTTTPPAADQEQERQSTRNTARQPTRRTLPRAQPQPADSKDDEAER